MSGAGRRRQWEALWWHAKTGIGVGILALYR